MRVESYFSASTYYQQLAFGVIVRSKRRKKAQRIEHEFQLLRNNKKTIIYLSNK